MNQRETQAHRPRHARIDWRRAVGLSLALSGTSAIAISGCNSTPGDCDFTCSDGYCAEGFTCNQEGWCVRPSSTVTCGNAGGAPGYGGSGGFAPGGSSNSGGIATTGGASGGTPNDPMGSQAGEAAGGAPPTTAGAGGTAQPETAGGAGCDSDRPELALEYPDEQRHACVDREVTLRLTARGGTPPYAWRLIDSPEFTLDTTEGDMVSLTGTPAETGERALRVAVADGCGTEWTNELSVDIRREPTLNQQRLPDACARHLYLTGLNLTHDGLPSSASTDSLPAGLTLDMETGNVTGTPEAPGEHVFELSVENACGSSSANLQLVVNDWNVCPVHQVPWVRPLRAPCLGSFYDVAFEALDAVTWSAIEKPPGLELLPAEDGLSARLVGTSTGPGTLMLQAQLGERYTVAGFRIEPRDACWLAYVSKEAEPKLKLIDPVLHPDAGLPRQARKNAVGDLAFSKNGRWLAYSAQGATLRELVVVNMSTWEEHTPSFPGDVTSFAWSENGVLAVAYRDGAQGYLGGVDGASIDWTSDTSTPFQSVLAVVDDRLTWFGRSAVAYFSAVGQKSRLYLAMLGAGGFGDPVVAGPDYVAPGLQATPDGVFVTQWSPSVVPNARLEFLAPPLSETSLPRRSEHRALEIIAPLGVRTGRDSANGFEMYAAEQETLNDSPAPLATVPGCARFLAWSEDSKRIVCADAANTIRSFTLTTPLGAGDPFPGTFVIPTEARRAFSPGGNWFAYSTGAETYVADLRSSPPSVANLPGTPNVLDFEFSPDEHFILLNVGATDVSGPTPQPTKVVRVHRLLDPSSSAVLQSAETSPCFDEFARAPDRWCGRARSSAGFAWSPTHAIVAHRDRAGDLVVTEVTNFEDADTTPVLRTGAETFAFQPRVR